MATSLSEAVTLLHPKLTTVQKDEIRNTKKDDLVMLHVSLGLWIRNTFGLHAGNTELLIDCSPENPNADDASGVIVDRFWPSLQED